MSGLPAPMVRSLIVCEDILVDPTNPNRVTLVNLVHSIRSTDSPPYPLRYRELCVFVQLTACRGPGRVRVEIREADSDEVRFATQTRTAPFPNDPVAVHGLRFRTRNCEFPAPGVYWIQLWHEDRLLARQPIILC